MDQNYTYMKLGKERVPIVCKFMDKCNNKKCRLYHDVVFCVFCINDECVAQGKCNKPQAQHVMNVKNKPIPGFYDVYQTNEDGTSKSVRIYFENKEMFNKRQAERALFEAEEKAKKQAEEIKRNVYASKKPIEYITPLSTILKDWQAHCSRVIEYAKENADIVKNISANTEISKNTKESIVRQEVQIWKVVEKIIAARDAMSDQLDLLFPPESHHA